MLPHTYLNSHVMLTDLNLTVAHTIMQWWIQGEDIVRIDVHTHTSRYSACSRITADELVAEALVAGLDAVLFTEHNAVWDRADLRSLSGSGLLVLGGVELTCPEGDCLLVAPDLDDLPGGLSLQGAAEEAHRRGGLAFLAHPFRTTLDHDRRYLANPLDGLEEESCNNFGRLERQAARAVAVGNGLHLIAGSDAHQRDMVGCFYLELSQSIGAVADLVGALRRGAYRQRRHDERFYRFVDAREATWRALVRAEVFSGTRSLEELKRTTGISSDIIRTVLAEGEGSQAPP